MSAIRLQAVIDSPEGDLSARHYQTGEAVRIRWAGGKITSLEPTHAPVDKAIWVAPALFDVQINGYGGIDYQLDETGAEELHRSAEALVRDGCPRFFLTLVTRHWPDLLANLRRYKAIRDADPILKRRIAGWHIEGPFISGEPGYVGAHPPDCVCDPIPEAIDELKAVVGNDPTLLTLAPEREGSLEAISRAKELGIVTSIGHAQPTSERLNAAVQAGVRGFTHLGNGCPQQVDRHQHIWWSVLDQPGLIAGIIPDTHHVAPPVFRLFHKALGEAYWTTDAMSAAGAAPGIYTLAKLQIEVGEDKIARQPGKTNFAGSALEPFAGIQRGAAMLGQPWQAVWDYLSVHAAEGLMGLPYGLKPGADAVFCLVHDEGR